MCVCVSARVAARGMHSSFYCVGITVMCVVNGGTTAWHNSWPNPQDFRQFEYLHLKKHHIIFIIHIIFISISEFIDMKIICIFV